ncbi:MAG: hypothetical protein KDI33_01595 [Halioglobus sp.]|nr:hypothetical protein [Halioglobus sp.]
MNDNNNSPDDPIGSQLQEHGFRWQPPETFNFAPDVEDRCAEDPDKLALPAENADGDQQSFTYAQVARRSCQRANLAQCSQTLSLYFTQIYVLLYDIY